MNKIVISLKQNIRIFVGLVVTTASIIGVGCSGITPGRTATGVFENKSPRWSYEAPNPLISTPVSWGDRIFVRTSDEVIALDATTGQLLWMTKVDSNSSAAPLISADENHILVPGKDGSISLLSAEIGNLIWHQDGNAAFNASVDSLDVSNEIALVSRYSDKVVAYSIDNGTLIWSLPVPGHYTSMTAAYSGVAYVQDMSHLQAFDIFTGALLWDKAVCRLMGQMTLDNDNMYIVCGASEETTVTAYNFEWRYLIWTAEIPSNQPTLDTFITLDEATLFVANDALRAISVDEGTILWRSQDIPGAGRPVIVNDWVAVRGERILYLFSKADGTEAGSLAISSGSLSSYEYEEVGPVLNGDLFIVPVTNTMLSAFELK